MQTQRRRRRRMQQLQMREELGRAGGVESGEVAA
jgi:hypothetical protein